MLTMNYTITLPADYAMERIRERVAHLGPTYDTLEHLGFKAFLITEAGIEGNQENSYAPFYVWRSEQGMYEFLTGSKFKGLASSFGWPPVRTGIVHSLKQGQSAIQPAYATRELITIAPHTDMSALCASEKQLQDEVIQSSQAFLSVVSFDPSTWTLVRLTLWDQVPQEVRSHPGIQCLTLLHLSAPLLNARR